VGAVLWQAHAGELWRRFTIALWRAVAAGAGLREAQLGEVARVSYAKVAEYQRRGLVHFHAVVRVDGPAGPGDPAPAWATPELLESAVRAAAASVVVESPASAAVGTYLLRWGDQVDVQPITADQDTAAGAGTLTDRRVAGYVAKYATKGTGATTGADARIRSEAHIEDLPIAEHHRQMMRTAWRLGGLPEFAGLNLRRWAHMLGFRGHFLTKSRTWSTTFTALRAARAAYRLAEHKVRLGVPDDEPITVINHWDLVGVGYRNPAERELAEAIGARVLDRRRSSPQGSDRDRLPRVDGAR
ncbi:replication initiator, partial [Longimycelium tulufanense]|uniref:replication initiator n=1 Tax=Longimycelium tulufanense TaxID=907463 RepID=UPI0035709D41